MHEPKLYRPTKKRSYWLIYYYTSSGSGHPVLKKIKRSSEEKAEAEFKRIKRNFEQFGHRNILTEGQIGDYRRARQLMTEVKVSKSVSEIVAEWIAFQPTINDFTVSEVADLYLESPKYTAKRPDTRKSEKSMMRRFEAVYGETWAKQVTYETLEGYIGSLGVGVIARNDQRRFLKMFFKWCASRRNKYIPSNPAEDLEAETEPPKPKPFLTVEQVKAVFTKSEECDPGLLASLALSFFAGIRPAEILRLSPSNIDLARKAILIPKEEAKTGEGRLIQNLPENLWHWLKINVREGLVVIERGDHNKRRKKIFDAAGVVMQNSIGRHTFASYGLVAKDLGLGPEKTSLTLGHSSPATTTGIYSSRLVRESDAKRYFAIRPSKSEYEVTRRTKVIWPDPLFIKQCLEQGMSNAAIGQKVGVSEAAVRKFRKKHGL